MSEEVTESKPFMEHLDELLARLRKSFIYLILGCMIGYSTAEFFVKMIQYPLHNIPFLPPGTVIPRIITTEPFEKFWVYLKLAMISGVFFALPVIAYEVSQFIGPGLKKHEKGRVAYLTASVYVTFIFGIFIGYKWVLPFVLSAIVRFGSSEIEATWTMRAFVNNSLGILLVTAILIQLPVIMTHLSSWNWVSAKAWIKGRRMAIVANAVVSGILSPPDALSMILMMVPIQLLYESGIVLARVAEWMANEKTKKIT